jgi:uncharacterized membrane protein YcaP (DUF421 family)
MSVYSNLFSRAVFAILILTIITRIMGKRELGKISTRDFVVALTLGPIIGNACTKVDQKFLQFMPALIIILGIQFILSYACLKSDFLIKLTNGEPLIIIQDGKILEKNLKKCRLNVDELLSQLRQKDVFKLSDVWYAILEQNGSFSVLLKSEKHPVTRKDQNIQVNDTNLPLLVIKDGKLIKEKLHEYNFTEAWIKSELKKQKIDDISYVMLAQIDNTGIIYVDKYEKF